MATRDFNMPDLTPGQAAYVLERLVRDRRITAADVSRYSNDMRAEIDELERRLAALKQASAGAAAVRRPAAAPARVRTRAAKAAKGPVTPSMQLQGRYLGLIRQIPENRRAQYAKVAKEKGREAAIREMQAALGKSGPAAKPAAPGRRRRKMVVTDPKVRASMQLQGRYLGLLRQIPANRRAQYQKIAREKGREVAISQMTSALKK